MATVLCCDKCSKVPATRHTIPVEKCTDGAGSPDTRDIILDLCDSCIRQWFKTMLKSIELKGRETRDIVELFLGRPPEVV